MLSLLQLISTLISLYIWVLIGTAVFSWLLAFDILNRRQRAVQAIALALWRLTEPVLRPFRRILPDLGGIDISPVIVIVLLFFARDLMWEWWLSSP